MSRRSKRKTSAKIRKLGVNSVALVRSNQHMSLKLVSPEGIVKAGLSTMASGFLKKHKTGSNIKAAAALGKDMVALVRSHKIESVAFNRSGHIYHGRVKAVAEALRAGGILV